ncbi:hypothetical protein THTE_3199 [Thermogutta terrifontis]|uniref:Uncharacterized protein n=1 Tax=Thermogutta terrifontis TaxID=1331910 RepID=A0A286RIL8_9BACT|nr:hypothetical protein THTE_3199 [Thermogutta terrifontis]
MLPIALSAPIAFSQFLLFIGFMKEYSCHLSAKHRVPEPKVAL